MWLLAHILFPPFFLSLRRLLRFFLLFKAIFCIVWAQAKKKGEENFPCIYHCTAHHHNTMVTEEGWLLSSFFLFSNWNIFSLVSSSTTTKKSCIRKSPCLIFCLSTQVSISSAAQEEEDVCKGKCRKGVKLLLLKKLFSALPCFSFSFFVFILFFRFFLHPKQFLPYFPPDSFQLLPTTLSTPTYFLGKMSDVKEMNTFLGGEEGKEESRKNIHLVDGLC